MGSQKMLGGALASLVAFLVVIVLSPHRFAIAWAEAWICAFLVAVCYSLMLWWKKERRD